MREPSAFQPSGIGYLRRLQPGENPDTEIGRFLTEVAHFPRIAPFLGEIRGSREGDPHPAAEQTTLAMLQGFIENEGDGWQFTLDEIARCYEDVVTSPLPMDTDPRPPSSTNLATNPSPAKPVSTRPFP